MRDTRAVLASGHHRAEQADVHSSSAHPASKAGALSLPSAVGASFVIDGEQMIFLGRTGDGRYAFIDAVDFGCHDRATPRIVIRGRIGTEIALGYARPVKRHIVDRRGRWTNRG